MRVRVQLMNVTQIAAAPNIGLIILVDEQRERVLIIPCDRVMRESLIYRIDKMTDLTEKMLPEVLWGMLSDLGSRHFEVQINDLVNGEFITELVSLTDGRRIPMRASDALLFSQIAHLPIYVDGDLMNRQSAGWFSGMNQGFSLPLNVIESSTLKNILKDAIEAENYELASKVRDVLEMREKSNNNEAGDFISQ